MSEVIFPSRASAALQAVVDKSSKLEVSYDTRIASACIAGYLEGRAWPALLPAIKLFKKYGDSMRPELWASPMGEKKASPKAKKASPVAVAHDFPRARARKAEKPSAGSYEKAKARRKQPTIKGSLPAPKVPEPSAGA